MQSKVNFVNLDSDQQGHFIVLLTDQINDTTNKIVLDASDEPDEDTETCACIIEDMSVDRLTQLVTDQVFYATLLGHVIDNRVDEKSLDYLTTLDEERSEVR